MLAMDRTTLLRQVMGVLKMRPRTWQDCVVWALGHWQLCFHDGIVELLRHLPCDKVGSQWLGS